ncbi:MAG: hypothetical protein ABIF10_01455 [Candidatus Woesearchaeota archaeon]
MATPLDFGLLAKFGAIFPFLLVFVVVYAVLNSIKVFGDKKGIDAMIAFLAAVMVLFSDTVRMTIERMAPWFVLFFFFLIFLSIAYMIFGAKKEDIFGAMKGNRSIILWILSISLIIGLGSLTSVMSEKGGIGVPSSASQVVNASSDQVAAANQQSAFWATITHPKVLGMVLILLVALFTVQRMTAM